MYFGWITKATFFTALLLGVVFLGLWLQILATQDQETKVVFLAVGQGDATLIQSGRQQILIDGGRDGRTLLDVLGREIPFYDRTIEVVIATHPDADHIGGLATLFDRYRVAQFIETGALDTKDTIDSELVIQAKERAQLATDVLGQSGVRIELAKGGTLTLLYPARAPLTAQTESNEGSIVARFDFGETSFLFTGDLPREETFLPTIQPIDVLKVAHHGSRYSTSDTWLQLTQPKEAIISVGKNSYGHPHGEVVERLTQRGISLYRTDERGSIVYQCLAGEQRCIREE